MTCLLLAALPATAVLRDYCTTRYAKELQEKFQASELHVTNPEANVYVIETKQVYKRSLVWKLVITYTVVEYDEPILELRGITIYTDDDTQELQITCKYNTDPKNLRYRWGEFVDVEVSKPKNTGFYMLVHAVLKSDWIHDIIFNSVRKKVIRPVQKHANVKPTAITNIATIADRVNEVMQSI